MGASTLATFASAKGLEKNESKSTGSFERGVSPPIFGVFTPVDALKSFGGDEDNSLAGDLGLLVDNKASKSSFSAFRSPFGDVETLEGLMIGVEVSCGCGIFTGSVGGGKNILFNENDEPLCTNSASGLTGLVNGDGMGGAGPSGN